MEELKFAILISSELTLMLLIVPGTEPEEFAKHFWMFSSEVVRFRLKWKRYIADYSIW